MGMFDTVSCRSKLPDPALGAEVVCQTYSLGRGMQQYSISEEGRLLWHPARFEVATEVGSKEAIAPQLQRIELPAVDLAFHGDILLYCTQGTGDQSREYVARFTQGVLAWIRPLIAVSAIHQHWLHELGSH